MVLYLRAKFQVSSMILTSFRQRVILPQLPPQNKPLTSPPRFRLNKKMIISDMKLFSKWVLDKLLEIYHKNQDFRGYVSWNCSYILEDMPMS